MSGPYDQQVLNQVAGRGAQVIAGQVGGPVAGLVGGQVAGLAGGQLGGQTVTQSSTFRATESYQTQPPAATRSRRQRNGSSSSSSASERAYRVSGSGVAAATHGAPAAYQQYAAESQYSQGGYGGGSHSQAGYTGYAGGDSYGSVATGPRRQARYQKQVIRLPDQQGQVRQVRRRLPTPEPDVLERVYIQRTGNEIVEEITEIPTTPPPRVQERTVVEPAGPPQVVKHVIRVPPRSGGYANYQQQGAAYGSNASQAGGSLLSAGSYGNVQQATNQYQQYSGAAAPSYATSGYGATSGGYGAGGYGATSAGYGATSAGYGATSAGYGTTSGGYGAGGYGAAAGGYGSYGGGYQQSVGSLPTQIAGRFPGIPPNATCFLV